MKKYLITAVLFLSANTHGHETGSFYVIPTGEVVTKELCNGSPVNSEVFTAYIFDNIEVGSVYATNKNSVVEVTGITSTDIHMFGNDLSFITSLDGLSRPSIGSKGPFFALWQGEVIFVRFL